MSSGRFSNIQNLSGSKYHVKLDLKGDGNLSYINYEKSVSLEKEQDENVTKFKELFPGENASATTKGPASYKFTLEALNDVSDPVTIELAKCERDGKSVYFELYSVVENKPIYFGTATVTTGNQEFSSEDSATIEYTFNVQGEVHKFGVNDKFVITYTKGQYGAFTDQTFKKEYRDRMPSSGLPKVDSINPAKYEFVDWCDENGEYFTDEDIMEMMVRGDKTFVAHFKDISGEDTTKKKVTIKAFEKDYSTYKETDITDKYDILPASVLEVNIGDTIEEAIDKNYESAEGLINIRKKSDVLDIYVCDEVKVYKGSILIKYTDDEVSFKSWESKYEVTDDLEIRYIYRRVNSKS